MIVDRSPTPRAAVRLALLMAGLMTTGQGVHADGAADLRGWYAGIGTGLSRLTPDADDSPLGLDDDTSTAIVGWVGRDLGRRLSIEAAVSDLGEARLGRSTVGYRAASIGVLGHVLGDPERIARRDGASVYLRAGLSVIDNDSDLDLQEADDTAVWAGAGVDWPVARTWGLRSELTSYDGDAQAAWLGVYARLRGPGGSSRRGTALPPVPAPVSEPDAVPVPVPDTDTVPEPSIVPREASRAPDAPLARAPVTTPSSGCVAATATEPQGDDGCALFAGVLEQVDFLAASDRLTPVAGRVLERLAERLARYPGTVVEIRAHVAPMLTRAAAQRLSRERALAVARRLVEAGVPVAQLRARAFGDRQPPVPVPGETDRRGGARIEIAVPR